MRLAKTPASGPMSLAIGNCHAPPSWGHPLAKVMGPREVSRRPMLVIARHGVRVESPGARGQASDVFTERPGLGGGGGDAATAGGGLFSIDGFSSVGRTLRRS